MKINSSALSLKAWRVRRPPSPPTPPPPLASSPPSAVLGREAWPPTSAASEDEPRFGLPFGGGAAKRLLDRLLLMQKSDAVNLVSASSNAAATATGRKEESREGDARATRLNGSIFEEVSSQKAELVQGDTEEW